MMDRNETARLLSVLQAAWPNYSAPNPEATVSAYQLGLDDVPYEAAMAAAREWIKTGKFFPTASELRHLIAEHIVGLPSPGEAWEMVMARMRSTIHGMPTPTWEAPLEVRRAVEALGGMYILRMSERPGVDRSNFLEIYGSYRERAVRNANLTMIGSGSYEPGLGNGS